MTNRLLIALMIAHLIVGGITAAFNGFHGQEVECEANTPIFICGTPIGAILDKVPSDENPATFFNLINPFFIIDFIEDVLSLFSFNNYTILEGEGLAALPLWILRMLAGAAAFNLVYQAATKVSSALRFR